MNDIYSEADNCNYWYDQVPKSSNQTTCSTGIGASIPLTCVVYHPCGNISIQWYRSLAEAGDIENRRQRINNSAGGKYLFLSPTRTNVTANNSNFINCCFTLSQLSIYRFSEEDVGYYWCRIVTPNRRLQSSPYAFISLHHETVANSQTCTFSDYINQLHPPICATDRNYFSTSETRTCNSTTTEIFTTTNTASHTKHVLKPTYVNSHSTTTLKFTSTTHGSTIHVTTSQFPWVYLLPTGVVAILLVSMLSLFILSCRYRTLWKKGKWISFVESRQCIDWYML